LEKLGNLKQVGRKRGTTLERIAYLVGFWPDYETSFFRQATYEMARVSVFNPLIATQNYPLVDKYPRPLRNRLYRRAVDKLVKENPDAIFILQENRFILDLIPRLFRNRKAAVFNRNIVQPGTKSHHALDLAQSLDVPIYSFDQDDCNKYDYRFCNQIISKLDFFSNDGVREGDICFVGRNKGREPLLRQYQAALSEVGVTLDVILVGATKYDSISYIDYLTLQLNARCILDVGQADQRGLTLRPLEAACYEKKLISNNRFLAQEPFYDPQNILILEEEFDAKAVKHFLMSPKRPVPDEVLRQYDPGYVIDRIIEDLGNVPTNP
jgi:hypothetical protein